MKRSYEDWKYAVDMAVSSLLGLSVDDLPDCPLRDWYDDGMSPASAARQAIQSAEE